MSVLNDIQAAIALRLRNQTVETLAGVGKAAECIVHLQQHGSTVQSVTVRRHYVVIEIDKPSAWLHGAMHIVRVNGRYRETVKVAPVLGCQVQWTERVEHPLLKREG